MDKAEEIFAEGIEDRNVKTIRQARVLFVICLMAGMFIIFESDDIFKWVAVLAVYFFTDSFYKKYLRVEANLADDMTGNDIYQFIGQHALSVDCYFGIISKKNTQIQDNFFGRVFFVCHILRFKGVWADYCRVERCRNVCHRMDKKEIFYLPPGGKAKAC